MKKASDLMNLFGQIRIYSFVDLILLLIAISANRFEIAGVLLLHLGFILFLESNHKHEFRVAFPKYLWLVFILLGLIFYHNIGALGFLLCSILYVNKKLPELGWPAPIFRGLQLYFLVAGIAGFLNPVSFLAFGLIMIRNFTGDLRDVMKDKKDDLRTLPIIFGMNRDFKHSHLFVLMITSAVWWHLSGVAFFWLLLVFAMQLWSYNLTPR